MTRRALFLASSLSVLAGIAAAQDGDREADARARAAEEVGNVVESTPGQREATPGRCDLEKSLEGKGTPPGKGDLNRELEGKR